MYFYIAFHIRSFDCYCFGSLCGEAVVDEISIDRNIDRQCNGCSSLQSSEFSQFAIIYNNILRRKRD